jgi:hypothetical protein
MELVAGAGEAAKAHALEAMLDLQVCKTHFYFLARIARSFELGRALERPGMVACADARLRRALAELMS